MTLVDNAGRVCTGGHGPELKRQISGKTEEEI